MQIIYSYVANYSEYEWFGNWIIWPKYGTLTDTTTLVKFGPVINGNEVVLHTPQISRIET